MGDEALHEQISRLETELARLKSQLLKAGNGKDSQDAAGKDERPRKRHKPGPSGKADMDEAPTLSPQEIQRYGRQMIVPVIGRPGQLRLKKASVVVIGVGGLGCPAAAYLTGAGIGRLGLVDGDQVEVSNLHRQTLHATPRVGQFKVDSAVQSLSALNPTVTLIAHREHLTPYNAATILAAYDIVLDCTDHPTSRYLVSDVAVLLGKSFVSAAALGTEGQLMVLNHPPRSFGDPAGGPCYRCVFPKPPPPATVIGCGEGGILGPVVGTLGVLQALEAIKLIAAGSVEEAPPPTLLLFSAYSTPLFRSVRLRTRRLSCAACSEDATITLDSLTSGLLDYVQFCGLADPVKVLGDDERISAREYDHLRHRQGHLLVDVRDRVQFDLCNLPGSINIPWSDFRSSKRQDSAPESSRFILSGLLPSDTSSDTAIYVVCRYGNDSQLAVRKLKELGIDANGSRYIGDIRGGLKAWKAEIDQEWPEY